MTLTVTLPDEVAARFVTLPQAERDSLIADLLTDAWGVEDDLRLAEEAAIERGIAEFEAGQTMSHETFTEKWDAYRARARAK